MQFDIVDLPQPFATEYLSQIEMLTSEIQSGMDAIGANALSAFQESVLKQQQICASLCMLNEKIGIEATRMEQASRRSNRAYVGSGALAQRIRLAAKSLQTIEVSYAALLKHCEDSARLFSGLCLSYSGHYQEPSALFSRRPQWSTKI